jgi:hypothetical protein
VRVRREWERVLSPIRKPWAEGPMRRSFEFLVVVLMMLDIFLYGFGLDCESSSDKTREAVRNEEMLEV